MAERRRVATVAGWRDTPYFTDAERAALALAVVMNFASYFFSDKIALAMYSAKEAGRNGIQFYDESMDARARSRLLSPA